MKGFDLSPEHLKEHNRLRADLTNAPCIGTEGNYAWQTAQLNIAEAQPANSSKNLLSVHLIRN